MYPNYVKFEMESCQQPAKIDQNKKYQAFKKALGALDGVFVPVSVPSEAQSPLQNQKGLLAQNEFEI